MKASERARPAAAELERAFYAALEAVDRFAALMDELAAGEENPELVRRFHHLRREAAELTAALETAPLETVLRIIDRVPMIALTEDGKFV